MRWLIRKFATRTMALPATQSTRTHRTRARRRRRRRRRTRSTNVIVFDVGVE